MFILLYVLGYGGKNCSENIDDCSTNPCQNSGVCIDLVGDHLCNCTEGKICCILTLILGLTENARVKVIVHYTARPQPHQLSSILRI